MFFVFSLQMILVEQPIPILCVHFFVLNIEQSLFFLQQRWPLVYVQHRHAKTLENASRAEPAHSPVTA
jgi:hypothetical protein